jgi:NAD(P)-dependent dehydrogenase (short-subunit alcohol dehydrogenase family)
VNLNGKVAIVTGSGGKGTGRATARWFAREGAAVVVGDVNDAGGRHTVALIEAEGGRGAFRHTDMRAEAEVRALVVRGGNFWRPGYSD